VRDILVRERYGSWEIKVGHMWLIITDEEAKKLEDSIAIARGTDSKSGPFRRLETREALLKRVADEQAKITWED
jgi:hypothetical protein